MKKPARTKVFANLVVAAALLGSCGQLAQAQMKTGKISVSTGTTFRMEGNSMTYRIWGIEACEPNQRAHLNGIAWPCGAVATGWLTQTTLGYDVDCLEVAPSETDYATVLVRCFLPDGEDIAKLALQEGMAWTVDQDGGEVDPAYAQIESEARLHRRGIWSSNFMRGHNLFRP